MAQSHAASVATRRDRDDRDAAATPAQQARRARRRRGKKKEGPAASAVREGRQEAPDGTVYVYPIGVAQKRGGDRGEEAGYGSRRRRRRGTGSHSERRR